jgi:hypothetical protein
LKPPIGRPIGDRRAQQPTQPNRNHRTRGDPVALDDYTRAALAVLFSVCLGNGTTRAPVSNGASSIPPLQNMNATKIADGASATTNPAANRHIWASSQEQVYELKWRKGGRVPQFRCCSTAIASIWAVSAVKGLSRFRRIELDRRLQYRRQADVQRTRSVTASPMVVDAFFAAPGGARLRNADHHQPRRDRRRTGPVVIAVSASAGRSYMTAGNWRWRMSRRGFSCGESAPPGLRGLAPPFMRPRSNRAPRQDLLSHHPTWLESRPLAAAAIADHHAGAPNMPVEHFRRVVDERMRHGRTSWCCLEIAVPTSIRSLKIFGPRQFDRHQVVLR